MGEDGSCTPYALANPVIKRALGTNNICHSRQSAASVAADCHQQVSRGAGDLMEPGLLPAPGAAPDWGHQQQLPGSCGGLPESPHAESQP